MMDWLRYFPIAFRKKRRKGIPKGPYFSRLWQRQWLLGDNVFEFLVPWSNSVYGLEELGTKVENHSPEQEQILNCTLRPYNESVMPNKHWEYSSFYSREWVFVGAWFTGEELTLKMTATLLSPSSETSFLNGASLFHPRVLETAISDYLSSRFGHDQTESSARYRGPLGWNVIPFSINLEGAVCSVDDNEIESTLRKLVFLPVDKKTILLVQFLTLDVNLVKKEVDDTCMRNLMENIINSFTLKIGKKTQAEIDEIKKECPDLSLTKEFGELEWPIKIEKKKKNEEDWSKKVKVEPDGLPSALKNQTGKAD